VSLAFIPDAQGVPGAPVPVFSNVSIPLAIDGWDFRAGIGIRTGGANADMDFDNLSVSVPEPATAGLLALGGLLALRRRRR
jgi:PEP-CTERM motif